MNRLKYLIILIVITLFLLGGAAAYAGSIKGASLTIYNTDRALVKETRSVNLPKGMAGVVFKEVPATLDPTSVHAVAKDMSVLDVQYSYTPITSHNLLSRYVGKEVTLILPDPADANGRVQRKATLLSVEDEPIFQVGQEIFMGEIDGVLFPDLPKDLQREPLLTLTTSNASAAKRDVLLSYLMGGISWQANYTLAVANSGETASLGAWATITNNSGRGFVGTNLKLVAGDVSRARGGRPVYAKAVMVESAMAMDAAPPSPEEFSQFHVYSVSRPVNIAESGTRHISLFSSPKVKVKEELVSIFHGGIGPRRGEIRQNVAVNLLLENTANGGLGRPMPGGLVRVYRPTIDGSQLLAGESRISHVGKGGKIRLTLGQAFDFSVRRTQTSFKKVGKNGYEVGWKIEVTNGKAKAQQLTLRDTYSGQWEVLSSSLKHTTPDSGSLEYALNVPSNAGAEPLTVNYTVRVTY